MKKFKLLYVFLCAILLCPLILTSCVDKPNEIAAQIAAITPTPTPIPTVTPTLAPTATPTLAPTATPTLAPTATPTLAPTAMPTPVPTATPTLAPTAMSTLAPTATPTLAPEPPPITGIQFISLTSPVGRNETATVTIKGVPNTVYTIEVMYKSGASTAKGLEAKTSDSSCMVSWSWHIGGNTTLGTYKIIVNGGSQTKQIEFTVK